MPLSVLIPEIDLKIPKPVSVKSNYSSPAPVKTMMLGLSSKNVDNFSMSLFEIGSCLGTYFESKV
jgi:hypothetical protein